MKPRKDQTDEQRVMRDMGALMLKHMKDDGDKSEPRLGSSLG